MSTIDLTQTKADIEKIFSEVNTKLESLITHNTTLLMSVNGDTMHERLFAFCDELEGLRKKISNQSETLAVRMECVGDVAQYIQDMLQDVTEFKQTDEAKTASNEIMNVMTAIETSLSITAIETSLGIIAPDVHVIEDTIISEPQTENEAFFTSKLAAIEKIVADHPELQKTT